MGIDEYCFGLCLGHVRPKKTRIFINQRDERGRLVSPDVRTIGLRSNSKRGRDLRDSKPSESRTRPYVRKYSCPIAVPVVRDQMRDSYGEKVR